MVKDLSVRLCETQLQNPVIPASGVYGFGGEYRDFYDPNILGAMVLKGTTRSERFGNPTPRIAECTAGMINSIGLQNPGVDAVARVELPELRKFYSGPVIANVSGFSVAEYAGCCSALDGLVDIIEVNISCPNVHGGGACFGSSPGLAAEVTRAAKGAAIRTPVFMKLSPNVTDISEIALACEQAGADGISLINTLMGMRIDIKSRKPVIANKMGGFSGPAVFPVAVRMVYEVSRAVKIPVMGIGGVSCARDVIEMMMAGATAVQVGAENLRNPMVCADIISDLPGIMDELGIDKLVDIIGVAE